MAWNDFVIEYIRQAWPLLLIGLVIISAVSFHRRFTPRIINWLTAYFGENFTTFTFWFLQIVPPFCLILLCWVPMDLGPSLFWMPIVAFPISLYTLPRNLINAWKSNGDIRTAVRPALTIFITFLPLYSVQYSYNEAIKQVTIEAKKIQTECNNNGICPSSIEGWEKSWGGSEIIMKSFGALIHHTARYSLSPDGKQFQIYLRKNIDTGYILKGGSGLQLEIL